MKTVPPATGARYVPVFRHRTPVLRAVQGRTWSLLSHVFGFRRGGESSYVGTGIPLTAQ